MADIADVLTPAERQAAVLAANEAVKARETKACDKCAGTGIYAWVSQHPDFVGEVRSGICRRCSGKGALTPQDQARNYGYDRYRANLALLTERGLTPADLLARQQGTTAEPETTA